ncbi:MAG: MFS transporter [Candidatus Lariskella arthropodorum]
MLNNATGLTAQQREAVSVLSIGTLLEYFDLMLTVHMSIFLNELFFPQSDPIVVKLFAAFTFSATFILRPIGGFVIGWIGDRVGRKSTIIITTSIMAVTCVLIANIGTYEEIGITATITMVICRMLQGFSSLGEIVGAQLYLAETIKQPYRYVCNGIISIASKAGGLFALTVASFAISMDFNWRMAFWIGAIIAVVGFVARMRLRETPEFVDFRLRMKIKAEISKQNPNIAENLYVYKKKADKKIILAYCFAVSMSSVCFYMTFIYMGNFMKEVLGMSYEQVINQNLRVHIMIILIVSFAVFFLKKYHPIKIASIFTLLFCVLLPFLPYCLDHASSVISLTCLQLIMLLPTALSFGVEIACFKHIPIARRFVMIATTFGVSVAFSILIVSFSVILLTEYIGHYAVLSIYTPSVISFLWAIKYIKKLEKKSGKYFHYPNEKKSEISRFCII